MTGPRIGSLFSGYGGLDEGVRSVIGGTVAWHCEYDAAPSKVLAHHWPDVPNLGDITAVDWAQVPPVDVVTGGYPCQPFSTAGKRKGADDPRHLWPHMLRAIRVLRPRLVVAENVRGHLRLGFDTVLRDLAAIGFDAEWVVVRASAAGAPHRRERLFIAAHPHGEHGDWAGIGRPGRWGQPTDSDQPPADADLAGLEGRSPTTQCAGERATGPGRVGTGAVTLLPTPQAHDAQGPKTPQQIATMRAKGHGVRNLNEEVMTLLPTPKASDGPNGGPGMRNGRGQADALPGVVALLPTPTSQAAKHGALAPSELTADRPQDLSNLWTVVHTIGAEDGNAAEAGPDQALSDVRGTDDPQAVRQAARGHEGVPAPEDLRPSLWQHEDRGGAGGTEVAGTAVPGRPLPGVLDDGETARPPHRSGSGEQRPGQPDDAVRVVSPETALAGGPGEADGSRAPGTGDISGAWGPYAAAILRWEMVTGRVAPSPTEPGKDGRPRLSPLAVEWMMGLPEGHVTDPAIGLTRAQQLKSLGNGVVPQQCALAIRMLLGIPGDTCKRCDWCGQPYERRAKEAHWQYEERRFCSRKCADKGRRTTRVDDAEFKARYRQIKVDGRQVLEHRYIMEQHLGRRLERHEQVHHINGDRLDNRLENLELVDSKTHGERHTRHPVSKACVICGEEFTPHKTKRVRQQTCGPTCKSALLSQRNAERLRMGPTT